MKITAKNPQASGIIKGKKQAIVNEQDIHNLLKYFGSYEKFTEFFTLEKSS